MTDAHQRQFDAFYLFVRTDEKYEEVAAQTHDLKLEVENLKRGQEAMEGRVNQGVAVTGQNNAKALAEHAVTIGKLEQRMDVVEIKLANFIEESTAARQEMKEAIALLYKGIVGIFFTVLCGGGVLYALRVFHFR